MPLTENVEEAVDKVGKAIAEARYNDEMMGGYGLVTISPAEVLQAIYGGTIEWYDETLKRKVAKYRKH